MKYDLLRVRTAGATEFLRKDFVKNPVVVYLNGEINEEAARKFSESLAEATLLDQAIIPVVVSSYGGSVYSALEIADLIRNSEHSIATIVAGKAMSAGALIASCGTPGMRYITPLSTVMIHEASSSSWGKLNEMENSVEEVSRVNDVLLSLLSTNAGRESGHFKRLLTDRHHKDWFMDPTTAVEHGLADVIGKPALKLNVRVSLDLGEE